MEQYFVVNEDNLDEVVKETSFTRTTLKNELEDAKYRRCSLVVFQADGSWYKHFISEEYSIDWVMDNLAEQWAQS